MFFIASGTVLPVKVLEALRRGNGPELLSSFASSPLPAFNGDGFYCGLALLWLRERMMLDLLSSEYNDLARRLGAGRVCVILTPWHRKHLYDLIRPEDYSLEELAGYASASGSPAAGEGMRAALYWLKDCLGRIEEDQAAVLFIG